MFGLMGRATLSALSDAQIHNLQKQVEINNGRIETLTTLTQIEEEQLTHLKLKIFPWIKTILMHSGITRQFWQQPHIKLCYNPQTLFKK